MNTGNNLLYLLVSVCLGFMAVTGVCGHRNLTGLRFRVLPAAEMFARSPGAVRIQVKNQHPYLARFLLTLTLAESRCRLPAIAAGATEVVAMAVIYPRRGWQQLPPLSVESGFPVNFFLRSCRFKLDRQVLVYPAPLPATWPPADAGHQQTDAVHRSVRGGDGDLRNVDAYQPGDPLKAIHWKLSARHQELKTRRFLQQTSPSVILDPESFSGELEERLGYCAFLINQFSAAGHPVGLRLRNRQILPGTGRRHRLRLLGELALYD